MIKYTKNVLWLEDYVNSVKDIVPLEKIKKIKGYKVKLGMIETQEAAIHVANNKASKFNITIKLYDQEIVNCELKHVAIPIARVLDSLAHEMAHVIVFEHEPMHLQVQSRILRRFVKVMKKHNINDTWHKFTKYYE